MSGTVNKVILIGHLGRDPEIRTFQNGGKVANLRIATSESWKDRNSGERRERTEWHSLAVHADGLVGICERFLKKGSKIYVEGQLETRKWQDQGGADRYSTEIVLRPFSGTLQMLDARSEGSRDDGRQNRDRSYSDGSGDYSNPRTQRGAAANSNGQRDSHNPRHDYDDEIPF